MGPLSFQSTVTAQRKRFCKPHLEGADGARVEDADAVTLQAVQEHHDGQRPVAPTGRQVVVPGPLVGRVPDHGVVPERHLSRGHSVDSANAGS